MLRQPSGDPGDNPVIAWPVKAARRWRGGGDLSSPGQALVNQHGCVLFDRHTDGDCEPRGMSPGIRAG